MIYLPFGGPPQLRSHDRAEEYIVRRGCLLQEVSVFTLVPEGAGVLFDLGGRMFLLVFQNSPFFKKTKQNFFI